MRFKTYGLALFAILFLGACASYRPILDENDQYMKVGEAQAERDIDQCLARADAYLEKHKNDRLKKQVGRSAVTGAAIGGIIGALSGQNLGSAAGGAAIGGAAGAGGAYAGEKSKDQLSPDHLKQRYVTNCLARKKYEVIGWK